MTTIDSILNEVWDVMECHYHVHHHEIEVEESDLEFAEEAVEAIKEETDATAQLIHRGDSWFVAVAW